MNQTYTIILWRKAETKEESFDEISKRIYNTLSLLQKYDEIFRPNYLTITKKNCISKFEWNYLNFSSKLQNGVIKIGKDEMSELGYSLSFFSSLNENESCSVTLRVGNKNTRFVNSIIISLPVIVEYSKKSNSNMLKKLFIELVNCFEPYWGCVSNNKFKIGTIGHMCGNKPLYIHWLNYWSKDVTDNVASSFFENLVNFSNVSYKDNILQLSENAFDYRNEKDFLYFQNINNYYLNG